jgi:hypothetical protein
MANRYVVEVYISELDPIGNQVESWTVEGHDLPHTDAVKHLLSTTGSLFESGDLEPDPEIEYDEEDGYTYYDDLEPDAMEYMEFDA